MPGKTSSVLMNIADDWPRALGLRKQSRRDILFSSVIADAQEAGEERQEAME